MYGYSKGTIKRILTWNTALKKDLYVDLGTGSGSLFLPLLAHFKRGVGLDTSPEELQVLKERIRGIRKAQLILGSAEKLPFKNSSVDLITAAQCYMYFDRKKVLRESYRVIRDDGTLALLWRYPDEQAPLVQAITAASSEVKQMYKKKKLIRDFRFVGSSKSFVRAESVLRDCDRLGFSTLGYEERTSKRRMTQVDAILWAMEASGFSGGVLPRDFEDLFVVKLAKTFQAAKINFPCDLPVIEYLYLAKK